MKTDLLHKEDGQILVVVILLMVVLLGFIGLALDVGQLLFTKRQLQTAADAAALAGALEVRQCAGIANCPVMQTAAQSAMAENGLSGATLVTQCGASSGSDLTLTLNNGPCLLGAGDPNQGDSSYVEAMVSKKQPLLFASALGIKPVTVVARSESGLGAPTNCVFALAPSDPQAILVNGNGSMVAQCGVIDNSSSGTALLVNGHATLQATSIDVHGDALLNGNPTVSPSPKTGVPRVADPLAGTPIPDTSTCGPAPTTKNQYYGSNTQITVNAKDNAVFNPGTYCGGFQINGKATATFEPGTYVIKGNVIINGGDTVTGDGVTFYIDSGQWIMNGNSHADFSAPTDGDYAGILFYQNATDTSQFILNGDSTSKWEGAIYLPGAQLLLNGGSNLAAYTILDVNTLIVNGNNTFTIGNDYSSLPGGPPIGGTNAVLVE